MNLSSSGAAFDWVAGVYYLKDNAKSRLTFRFDQGLSGLPPGTYLENTAYTSDAEAWAVYGDGSWHATDKLNVIAGVRYSEERQHYEYHNVIGAIVGGQKFPFLNTCPARTDEPSFSSFTPRGGVQYVLDGDQNVYATVSKGFKSGGVNTNSCANEFNPEKITAYEAGYRSQWLNGDVTFNATAFYYDYTDLQLAQITGLVNKITNAAAAEVKGVELELAWDATANLSVNGSLSWLDATFASFDTLDTLEPTKGVQDLSGNRLPNAPEWSANLGAAYRWDPTPIGVFTARADIGYRSEVFLREFNQPLDRQAPYTLVNLSVIWDDPDETYSIRAYVNNLSDETYYDRMGSSDGFGARYVSYGAPRQAGVEFRARY
ncbi:MAG: TonB-dependent receptor [Hyphomonadaceae bacterium]